MTLKTLGNASTPNLSEKEKLDQFTKITSSYLPIDN